MATDVKITLLKSHIGKAAKMRAVLNGLGLNKRMKTVVLKDTPETRGMINKISHLVKVEE